MIKARRMCSPGPWSGTETPTAELLTNDLTSNEELGWLGRDLGQRGRGRRT